MIGLAELLESNFNSSDYAVIQNDVSYTYRQFGEVVHIYEEYFMKKSLISSHFAHHRPRDKLATYYLLCA